MINLKKGLIVALFIVLLISISGCKGKDAKKALEEVRTGTEGIVVSFLPNNPPDKIVVEESIDNPIDVVLELRNKGAYPQLGERSVIGSRGLTLDGKVYLSGFDTNIIKFETLPSADLSSLALEGKSTINPNGGLDFITFKANVIADRGILNVEKYEPIMLATACYTYQTVAGPVVCIDPNPYSTLKEKKVCEVRPIALSSQGAPIAVTKVDEEAFSTRTQFRITIKNVGNGDAMKHEVIHLDKCNPFGSARITREDIDRVEMLEAKIGDRQLRCGPFAESTDITSGFIRLINGEGSVICELPQSEYGPSKTAYTTPFEIRLRYAYRTTAEKKILIRKEVSTLSSIDGGEE